MFDRPRCRDWSPLSTQQLRLRSLIQVSGHNIVCDQPKCSLYFTLHTTTMSAPFYTSDKMDIHANVIWPEIHCPTVIKSSLRCVCIRVWQHSNSNPDVNTSENATVSEEEDKQLFLWGIYFSGLVPVTRRSEKRLKKNTLVFQLHDGFFTSADYILDNDEHQVVAPKTPGSLTSDGKRLELCFEKSNLFCDNSNSSPPGWYVPNSLLHVQNSRSLPKGETGSSQSSSSGRLVANSSDLAAGRVSVSPTPTEAESNLKIRYIFMEFLKSEIRTGYDVKRLLAIQERQRRIRYESESAKEITDRICMKSAYCLNLDLFTDKQLVYRSSSSATYRRGGMGKQLSRLLYQEREPLKPEILLKAQELRRQLELARFRNRILQQEKDRIRSSIRKLQQKLGTMADGNIESESTLMASYRSYGKEKEILYQQKLTYASEKESYRDLRAKVLVARHRLLKGLNEIYCIKKRANGTCSINDVSLPNAESYTDATPSLSLSVALGYVAHAVIMCSSTLNIPLRNPIKYEGSRSKMIDCIKVLPTADREFPLYCRSGPPTNALLYAVFLLNQNISQLKYHLCLSRGDPRATLANLHDILNVASINVLSRDIEEPLQTIQRTSLSGSSSVDLDLPNTFNHLTVNPLKESKSVARYLRHRNQTLNITVCGQLRRQQ
ncbi:UV radiation resistance-associated gene protein isoform X2 [Wyeomyia smithii]|uniref:UV radiation resistance-associated gene protein isoform X2 n=1 Tax=Wyeomyia smithii TaxID=174621 RepID=UPI0024680B06|nr:UV radiation resistance-associated gene protein isoform X2 [Wyeomyia smithii]